MERRDAINGGSARMNVRAVFAGVVVVAASLLGCSAGLADPEPAGRRYPEPTLTDRSTEIGIASWYGPGFDGKLTASGETFDKSQLTAAHRTLPFGTRVEVTDVKSRRKVVVRINDRGPFAADRIIDLAQAAAERLDIVTRGTARVELRVLGDGAAAWRKVRYSAQIGAFDQRAAADRFNARAAARGERTYLKVRPASAPSRYSVRVGPFARRSEAVSATERLRRAGYDPFVVEEDAQMAVPEHPAGGGTEISRSGGTNR